ncbi:conserved hypothetical protein [Burkholderiales bacterium 8X]|nr:conserved hypothetical protein [Burkholderiales bacterium 8X]
MPVDPIHVLQSAHRPVARSQVDGNAERTLLIAGATGALGAEVVRRLAGRHRFARTLVLAREPIREGMRSVETVVAGTKPVEQWPRISADVGLVLFEPARLYYDRERALWTPEPSQLPALAAWMRASGVQTLAIVQPHDQGRLPEALKRGLASLDEAAVVALGFERVILIRSARKPVAPGFANPLERLAAWMLSITRFMVPSSEQPVRASKVAELVDLALQVAPPGVHVAAPELVWQSAQGDMRALVETWLQPPR